MNPTHPIARFFGWNRRRTDEPASLDAADMGTAFGLDMSQPDPDEVPPTTVPGRPNPEPPRRR
jgi:hypothetical protein